MLLTEILYRFIIGGLIVSTFALIGDLFQPKSFAGLFGGAPSVALATMGLTAMTKGTADTATEAKSMAAGAVAFLLYAWTLSKVTARFKFPVWVVTVLLIPQWVAVALAIWAFVLR